MRQPELASYNQKNYAAALQAVQTGGYATAHPTLSVEAKAVIYHYTYRGSEEIKAPVRASDGRNDQPLGLALAAALAQLPPHIGLVWSAEWWPEAELQSLKLQAATVQTSFRPDEKRWPTFLSASQSRRVATNHLNWSSSGKNCLLLILSKTGRDVDALSHHGQHGPDPADAEREVLFLPNTRFIIVSVKEATTCVEIELLEL